MDEYEGFWVDGYGHGIDAWSGGGDGCDWDGGMGGNRDWDWEGNRQGNGYGDDPFDHVEG